MSTATTNGADGVKSSTGAKPSTPAPTMKNGVAAVKTSSEGGRKAGTSPGVGADRKPQPAPQTKAWQGVNPITQRVTPSSVPNGTAEKPLPPVPTPVSAQSPQLQSKSRTEPNSDKHAHDRLLYLFANFQGQDSSVTLKNGEQFTGIFAGGSFDSASKAKVVLKMCRRTSHASEHQVNGDTHQDEFVGEGEDRVMTFDWQDLADLAARDVTTAPTQLQANGTLSSFRTDTEISGHDASVPRHRELQRWEPGNDVSVDVSLEDSGETGWDQFRANEALYGVQSTYDENIYTTKIDRSDPHYHKRAAEAERIAREIEGSAPANAHVAEERRQDADKGDGLDEEEKYSGVRREPTAPLPKRAAGAYVPPSQRPITGVPTVPGAPFDPAIISTAKPVSVPQPAAKAETTKPSDGASRDSSRPPVPAAEKPTTDTLRQTADAFKEFANSEKLRLRQGLEQKRAGQRAEKNVRLNDLKKFAENFKLRSRVPDDLVPILAKDREKQVEIQRKAEESAKAYQMQLEEKRKKETLSATPPATSTGTAPPPPPPGPASEKRMPYAHSRTRQSQQLNNVPMMPGPIPAASPARPMGQRQPSNLRPQPLQEIRIPSGPAADKAPLSPASATSSSRFNIKAAEFRPIAANFTPVGTTPSPRKSSTAEPATASFFSKDSPPVPEEERKNVDDAFNPTKRMLEENKAAENQSLARNGGIPFSYRTPPTWPGDENRSYKDSFPKSMPPSQNPMHTPGPQSMPHANQLPPHMQPPTPQPPRPHFYAQHSSHGPPQGGYDPRMHQFGPSGSVHNSPRFPPAQMAFNQPHMQMPPHFAGQQMQAAYGMSPSMQPRQLVPQGAPMMMPQHFGQMPQGPRVFPPGPQYPGQAMGAQMMVPNLSQGPYMNGAMPPQGAYPSPMPGHVTPHMIPGTPGPPSFTNSPHPRPPMMQPSNSHHGYNPQQPPMMYGQSPGQHPMHWQQQRQMSGGGVGFPQMTPRQQHAMPMQGPPPHAQRSPGHSMGEEVKGG